VDRFTARAGPSPSLPQFRSMLGGVKRPKREDQHTPPSNVEVYNTWSSAFTFATRLHGLIFGRTLPFAI
jgi:hypothetical protein